MKKTLVEALQGKVFSRKMTLSVSNGTISFQPIGLYHRGNDILEAVEELGMGYIKQGRVECIQEEYVPGAMYGRITVLEPKK